MMCGVAVTRRLSFPIARQKVALIILRISLVLLEPFPCTAFLPFAWQQAIDKRIPRILPETHDDQAPTTHPKPAREIEDALQRDSKLRTGLYTVIALILSIVTVL